MEDNKWYEGVEKEINSLKGKISKGEYNDYGVGLLIRVAKRVEGFSPQCAECSNFKEQITSIIEGISYWPKTTKEQKTNYIVTFRNITEHLKRKHGLTQKEWPLLYPIMICSMLCALLALIPVLFGLLSSYEETRAWSTLLAVPVAAVGFLIGTILGLVIGLIINKIRRDTVDLSK